MTNGIMIGVCMLFFSHARLSYPWVYSGNVHDDRVTHKDKGRQLPSGAEKKGEETRWGWISASCQLKEEDCINMCGLDHWLLLEFTHMSMKILGTLAIPNLLIMAPLHCFAGG